MAWKITATQPVAVDPLRSQVSLLIRGDGANNSTAIADLSPTPKSITVTGARISTAVNDPFGQSTGVIYFDNSGDYLTVAAGQGIALPGDFTLEMWVYSLTLSADRLIDFRDASNLNNPDVYFFNTSFTLSIGGSVRITHQTSISTGVWRHFAVVRSAGTFRTYVDGVQSTGSYADSASYPAAPAGVKIGASYANGNILDGYIGNICVTQAARYTGAFAPPTAPFPNF